MTSPEMRAYGGVAGADRKAERRTGLIAAGLDLLGGAEGDQLTVRGVCKHARLTTRYFYENFADRDELVSAIYEHVVQTVAAAALAAVESAGPEPRDKAQAGLGALIRAVAGDPRHGRVLFSVTRVDPLLARKRMESSRFFAQLLIGQARQIYGVPDSSELELVAHFMVGGLAQTLTAWLDGSLAVSEEQLVAECAQIFTAIAKGETRSR
jgi:AcrR family transcriptional regulator